MFRDWIRGDLFRDWARSEGVEVSAPLDQLRHARVAIDAEEYLFNLLTATATREPLLPAHAGLPFALQKHVDQDLQNFKQAGISRGSRSVHAGEVRPCTAALSSPFHPRTELNLLATSSMSTSTPST